jgi:hypothetical protein
LRIGTTFVVESLMPRSFEAVSVTLKPPLSRKRCEAPGPPTTVSRTL